MFNETLVAALVERGTLCPIEGNPDLYGLGIRIGIYIQMITVQISAILSQVLRDEDYLGEATIVFILSVGSVLVSLLYQGKEGIQAVEAAPVLALLLAQVSCCRTVGTRSVVMSIIYAVELCGLIGLFVWYWWYGMDTLGRACPDDKAFFFAKVSLWGWFRTMNKVFTVFTAIYGVIAAVMYLTGFSLYAVMQIFRCFRRSSPLQPQEAEPEEDRNRFEPEDFGKLELVANIGVIVFVEMTLKWNNISGVHSLRDPGQFMPFFIALAQLLAVLYHAISSGLRVMATEDEDWGSYVHEQDCEHDSKFLFRADGAKSSAHDIELAPDPNAQVLHR